MKKLLGIILVGWPFIGIIIGTFIMCGGKILLLLIGATVIVAGSMLLGLRILE